MSETVSNWRVWTRPDVANNFTSRRRGGLLGGEAQIDTMLRLLKYVDTPQLAVLDLGCGDGILLQAIMSAYPVSRGIALDGSPAMLEKAEVRFTDLGLFGGLVDFVEADFNTPAWKDALPVHSFDAIVSGFAIHHSEDDRKRELYKEIFTLLRPGGAFINIEHVASETSIGEELFEVAYADGLAVHRRSLGEEITGEQVYEELKGRPDKAANRLTPINTQLDWLREIGFANVDCYWKQFELAVIGGFNRGS
jgi:tRNA (cmo5U34)-methyltransferase